MGSRDVPFEPEAVCDICGRVGAFDFMGDLLCPECSGNLTTIEEEHE